jgi:hypothetical protein
MPSMVYNSENRARAETFVRLNNSHIIITMGYGDFSFEGGLWRMVRKIEGPGKMPYHFWSLFKKIRKSNMLNLIGQNALYRSLCAGGWITQFAELPPKGP